MFEVANELWVAAGLLDVGSRSPEVLVEHDRYDQPKRALDKDRFHGGEWSCRKMISPRI